MLQSLIELSETNISSEITYKVTVYNNSTNQYPFLAVLYDEEFYDNANISFEISGFNYGDIIGAKETKDIYITFKYAGGEIPENTKLSSYLNFKIAEPNRLIVASNTNATGKYLGSTVVKNKIEKIKFELGEGEPQGTIESFDASENKDNSIIGYYTDEDGNELYELTFKSNEIIATNKLAYYLFSNLTSLTSIDFSNFSTYGATVMTGMFQGSTKLTELDLSCFDTSQVTNMGSMFYNCNSLTKIDTSNFNTSQLTSTASMFLRCTSLETIDLNHFDTSKVVNMNNMFRECSKLAEVNISNFNTSKVTNMNYMFSRCFALTTIYVSPFDASTEMGRGNYCTQYVWKLFKSCRRKWNRIFSNI